MRRTMTFSATRTAAAHPPIWQRHCEMVIYAAGVFAAILLATLVVTKIEASRPTHERLSAIEANLKLQRAQPKFPPP
jgi:hypothetical protein